MRMAEIKIVNKIEKETNMVNNLAFITGRETVPAMAKSAAKETVNVIKASTILPKLNISLPKDVKATQAVYSSPYASIGDLAEKSAAAGKRLNIAI